MPCNILEGPLGKSTRVNRTSVPDRKTRIHPSEVAVPINIWNELQENYTGRKHRPMVDHGHAGNRQASYELNVVNHNHQLFIRAIFHWCDIANQVSVKGLNAVMLIPAAAVSYTFGQCI